jgi:hypothetical protein
MPDLQAEQCHPDQQEERGGGVVVQAEPVRPDRLGDERARRERGPVGPDPAGPAPPAPACQSGDRPADRRAGEPEGEQVVGDGHRDRRGRGIVGADLDDAREQARPDRPAPPPRQRAGREAAKQPGTGRVHQGGPWQAQMRLDNGGGGADRGANQDADHERDGIDGQHAPHGFSDTDKVIGSHSALTTSGPAGCRRERVPPQSSLQPTHVTPAAKDLGNLFPDGGFARPTRANPPRKAPRPGTRRSRRQFLLLSVRGSGCADGEPQEGRRRAAGGPQEGRRRAVLAVICSRFRRGR